jgi:hypothetical protein
LDLQQKKDQLQKLKEKISLQKKKERQLIHELSQKERRKRTRELIIAGSLFERAGILGKYDLDQEFILGYLYLSSEFYENTNKKTKFREIGTKLLNKNDEEKVNEQNEFRKSGK